MDSLQKIIEEMTRAVHDETVSEEDVLDILDWTSRLSALQGEPVACPECGDKLRIECESCSYTEGYAVPLADLQAQLAQANARVAELEKMLQVANGSDLTAQLEAARKMLADTVTVKCKHKSCKCVYESDDGEFERWRCNDCGEQWGMEIPQ